MYPELIALGGAATRPQNGEKRPPIGGSAILLRYGEFGFLSDCGAYQARGKALEKETEQVIFDYKTIGGEYKIPIVKSLMNYLKQEDTLLPAKSDSILPDFSILNKVRYLIILLHHGHHDHVGGLPVLRKMLAGKGIRPIILATAPTRDFCKQAWTDQLKIMANKGQRSGYDRIMMYKLLKEIQIVNPGQTLSFGPFDITLIHAGHILGALSALVKVAEKKVFFTSDISFNNPLIPGATICSLDNVGKLDYLVSEFTYGKQRKHISKETESNRLINDVRKTLEEGGKVLIPALSIERVEIIFEALRQAGITKRWPVYINGLSAKISAVTYVRYGIIDSEIEKHFVENINQSYTIARSNNACVMIAPAGMMGGGWSVYFGSQWASDAKNLIAFTCYQIKGSPGYKLLTMKRGNELKLGDENICLRAKIRKYSLSAHASGEELEAMIERLKPKKTLLVHGEEAQIDNFVRSSVKNAEKMIVGKRYTI